MFKPLALRQTPQPMTSKLLAITFVLLLIFVWFVLTVGEAERHETSSMRHEGSNAPSVPNVSASSTGLSSRHRNIRGKRTAMPLL